jgi:hypothetical protein
MLVAMSDVWDVKGDASAGVMLAASAGHKAQGTRSQLVTGGICGLPRR